jgi:hypothetical protein
MKCHFLLLGFILFFNRQSKAQNQINFGFEDSYPQTEIAKGWKTGVDNGIYTIDNTISFSGKKSFKISSPSNNYPRTAYVEISKLLNRHRNTVIRIEAMVRFDSTQVIKPDLALDIRLNGKDTTLFSKIMTSDKKKWVVLCIE